jgi:two-component system nitrogen regulation response regulator NtrX
MNKNILIVDDEIDIREALKGILEDEGYEIHLAANSTQAYEAVNNYTPQLIILDIWLQNSTDDGLQILEKVTNSNPHIPIIMISGHGNIETAVSAMKQGAYDFIEKPFKSDRLLLMIDRALETVALRKENLTLKEKAHGPSELIGSSSLMVNLRQTLVRVAAANSRVLITGEAGTGKDLAAKNIHKMSKRANGPFLSLNCAIMHPERLENELFGVEGSPEAGVLERANSGTLFLDEVADMPLETQGKIVRVLQEQRFQRVGGQTPIEVDVRILASTNRNLADLMSEGKFRQDLYYRLNVVPIEMPTLRDRSQDIPKLVEYFSDIYSQQTGLIPCRFSDITMSILESYKWPGNVRQLRNVIEWMMIMSPGDQLIQPQQLPPDLLHSINSDDGSNDTGNMMNLPLREAREFFEKKYIESQLNRFNGNISKTANFVGMERSALHRKIKQLGITNYAKSNDEDDSDTVLKRA